MSPQAQKNKKSPFPPAGGGQGGQGGPKNKKSIMIFVIMGVLLFYFMSLSNMSSERTTTIPYNDFYSKLELGMVQTAKKTGNIISGQMKDGMIYEVYVESGDVDLLRALREKTASFQIAPPKTFWVNLVYSMGPMLVFIAFLWFFVYRNMASGGSRLFSFGKSRARQGNGKEKVTFKDVAGVEEAKEELEEIIAFLKDPKKFQTLGGKIPKGVLLMGPPGTGKTLLAKAVAGEAEVPFYSISGSDFVEMFVGVGASRVRDLFEQAKKGAASSGKGAIIFIDEIDAVGRQRFSGMGGGHDEREQTLNALLVEMDGFDGTGGVILIAATNRPDVLDPALLRPGRFDRQVVVDRPDIKGREQILKVHAKKIKLAKDVDLEVVARQTPGFSGADLANVVNEGALLAARKGLKAVGLKELEDSFERVVAGLERKSRVISPEEKRVIAYHESGHAVLAALIPEVDPLHKVSIIPRGAAALGYTMQLPIADKYLKSKKEFYGEITVLLGGRVAEEVLLGEITTGAQNDLERATDMAHKMICQYGMSEHFGYLTLGSSQRQVFLGQEVAGDQNYSEQTAVAIDNEVKKLIDQCYERAKSMVNEYNDQLSHLAEYLLKKEMVNADDVDRILKGEDLLSEYQEEPTDKGQQVDITIQES